MKVKIRYIILYVILLALLCFMLWFNHRRAALFFIVAMVVYLVYALVMQMKNFPMPEVKLVSDVNDIVTGDCTRVVCKVSSYTYWPFPRISARYRIRHINGTQSHYFEADYSVFHGSREYGLDMKLDYCGVYEVTYEELLVYDLFGFFGRKIACPLSVNIIVMPKEVEIDADIEALGIADEKEAYNDPLAGDDVSEIKELRDYREGDRLSQVHWKLSSKSEDFIVKEYSKKIGACVALVCLGGFGGLDAINEYYELMFAFGRKLLESELFFELVYYNASKEGFERVRVDNAYALKITAEDMFFNHADIEPEDATGYLEDSQDLAKVLCLSVNVAWNGTVIASWGKKTTIMIYDTNM